MFERNIVEGEK